MYAPFCGYTVHKKYGVVGVSRDKGWKGEVRGPCACPRPGGEVESPAGQAQGPLILVPRYYLSPGQGAVSTHASPVVSLM